VSLTGDDERRGDVRFDDAPLGGIDLVATANDRAN
jgi:hypothetical protein